VVYVDGTKVMLHNLADGAAKPLQVMAPKDREKELELRDVSIGDDPLAPISFYKGCLFFVPRQIDSSHVLQEMNSGVEPGSGRFFVFVPPPPPTPPAPRSRVGTCPSGNGHVGADLPLRVFEATAIVRPTAASTVGPIRDPRRPLRAGCCERTNDETATALRNDSHRLRSAADAQVARSKIVWIKGEPYLETQVAVDAPGDLKELNGYVSLFDKESKNIWNSGIKIRWKPASARRPAQAREDRGPEEPASPGREVQPAIPRTHLLGLAHFRRRGAGHPEPRAVPRGRLSPRALVLALQANAIRDRNVEALELASASATATRMSCREGREDPGRGAAGVPRVRYHPTRESAGPYTIEYKIENDALNVNFSASERFAWANVLLPVTSFELDDTTWTPDGSAAMRYDTEAPHSGTQASVPTTSRAAGEHLQQAGAARLALMARIWVKSNGGNETLHIRWRDHCDMTRAAWNWFPNNSQETVCRLDFEGWRMFRVPVLGAGMQARSPNGSTNAIDAPIYIESIIISPGHRRRTRSPAAREPSGSTTSSRRRSSGPNSR